MVNVRIITQAKIPFSAKTITAMMRVIARRVKKLRGTIALYFIGDTKMQRLNRVYRGMNKTTDVLSFAWHEEKSTPGVSETLGELYLCYAHIKRQAKRFAVTPQEELARMIVHGTLHLVGYDHATKKEAKKMFPLQEKLVQHITVQLKINQ